MQYAIPFKLLPPYPGAYAPSGGEGDQGGRPYSVTQKTYLRKLGEGGMGATRPGAY
jgi:hypothetical protein